MLSPPVYYTILALVSAFAFWRGRADERAAAAICILATFASNAVYDPTGAYAGVETGVFIVDAATFAGFAFIALRSERFWPMWLAGLQLTTVFSHMLKAIELDLMPLFPRDHWALVSHVLIFHGRQVCIARRPRCEICVLSDLCPSSRV